MSESENSQLQIKKAARRRLVGAIALTFFVAVVFPLVMDRDPGPMVQDIEVRIPGQADKLPKLATPSPEDSPAANSDKPLANSDTPSPAAVEKSPEKIADAGAPNLAEKVSEKVSEKTSKPPEKPADKATGQYIILIGAFNNEANVKHLRKKLDEIGVKSFTEPLGDKTRVRAGPFPSKESAEKALQRMKTIQIAGQIAPKP